MTVFKVAWYCQNYRCGAEVELPPITAPALFSCPKCKGQWIGTIKPQFAQSVQSKGDER